MQKNLFSRYLTVYAFVGCFALTDGVASRSFDDVLDQGISVLHAIAGGGDAEHAKGGEAPRLKRKKAKRIELTPDRIARLTGESVKGKGLSKEGGFHGIRIDSFLVAGVADFLSIPDRRPPLFDKNGPYGKLVESFGDIIASIS